MSGLTPCGYLYRLQCFSFRFFSFCRPTAERRGIDGGGGGSGQEFFKGVGVGSKSAGVFIY